MDGMRRAVRKIRHYSIPHQENNFKPKLLQAGGIVLLVALTGGLFFASNVYRIILRTTDLLATVLPSVLVDLANSNRSNLEVGPLAINPKLEEAARLKAQDMATKGYFAHYSPEGVSPWHWIREADYHFAYAGENLAVNFDDSDAVNQAWMNSPSHRANIVNGKFTEIGIATEKGFYKGRETTFVVEMFGHPAQALQTVVSPSPPVPTQTEKNLVPLALAEEEVLGEMEDEVFIAVEDKSMAPAQIIPAPAKQYSNLIERIFTSPTKMLGTLYSILAALIVIVLLFALSKKHERRSRHTMLLVFVLIIIFTAFSIYRSEIYSNVELSEAQKTAL